MLVVAKVRLKSWDELALAIMVIWVVKFPREEYKIRKAGHYISSQNTTISFGNIDFLPKTYLILYPSHKNSTTHITILSIQHSADKN